MINFYRNCKKDSEKPKLIGQKESTSYGTKSKKGKMKQKAILTGK